MLLTIHLPLYLQIQPGFLWTPRVNNKQVKFIGHVAYELRQNKQTSATLNVTLFDTGVKIKINKLSNISDDIGG